MSAPRYAALLFSLILSGMMSALVSGLTLWRQFSWAELSTESWIQAWLSAWLIAFPAVVVLAPLAQSLVRRLIKD